MTTAPSESRKGAGGRALAWGSFIASVVFPLTYLSVISQVVIRDLAPAGSNPFVVSLYTVFDYFEWPFPLLAVVLGHVALARGGPDRRLAVIGLVLGYLTIVIFAGIALALTITSWFFSH